MKKILIQQQIMAGKRKRLEALKGSAGAGLALLALLAIGAYAVMGPTGVLAWSDYQQRLEQRNIELAALKEQRDALRNRVDLLSPEGVDPDLAGELLRKELNVVHPDEIVVPLK